MKIGVFSAILSNFSLARALDHLVSLRCDCVEIGTGAYPGNAHCKPADFLTIPDWQWQKIAIPYWKEQVKFAADHGVKKIALEAHPGFLVYNPATMLRLRDATSNVLGANFDPSHFFWQGIDPIKAVR